MEAAFVGFDEFEKRFDVCRLLFDDGEYSFDVFTLLTCGVGEQFEVLREGSWRSVSRSSFSSMVMVVPFPRNWL
jgi:hypothetical protein